MTVILGTGYTLPSGDEPLTHARIAHAGNWLSGGTVSASGTAAGYYADGPDNSLTYERWQPDALPATWEYDHGSAVECDYCVIAAHTLGTNQNTLEVQYFDGADWIDVITAQAITTDEPIFVIFEPETRQRWRIRISDGTAPDVAFVKFGAAMQMPQAIYGGHAPIVFGRMTTMRSNYSETGEFLGRTVQRTMLSASYAWTLLRSTWVRANWPAFQKATESEPFVIAWRPATFGDVGFCQLDQTPVPANMGVRDYMSVEMNVRARGYD